MQQSHARRHAISRTDLVVGDGVVGERNEGRNAKHFKCLMGVSYHGSVLM